MQQCRSCKTMPEIWDAGSEPAWKKDDSASPDQIGALFLDVLSLNGK